MCSSPYGPTVLRYFHNPNSPLVAMSSELLSSPSALGGIVVNRYSRCFFIALRSHRLLHFIFHRPPQGETSLFSVE